MAGRVNTERRSRWRTVGVDSGAAMMAAGASKVARGDRSVDGGRRLMGKLFSRGCVAASVVWIAQFMPREMMIKKKKRGREEKKKRRREMTYR